MKITFSKSLCFFALLTGLYSYSQESNTVFVTGELKKEKMKRSFFEEAAPFTVFAFSLPFTINPEHDPDNNSNITNTGHSNAFFIPDGINVHAGYGFHTTQTFGLSVNTGIDALASVKIVNVPVYASLLVNPQINDRYSICLQAGIGGAFAIGRGNLSGLYQKYRIGIINDDKLNIFAEVNRYGYTYGGYSPHQISTFNLGVALINFK